MYGQQGHDEFPPGWMAHPEHHAQAVAKRKRGPFVELAGLGKTGLLSLLGVAAVGTEGQDLPSSGAGLQLDGGASRGHGSELCEP